MVQGALHHPCLAGNFPHAIACAREERAFPAEYFTPSALNNDSLQKR